VTVPPERAKVTQIARKVSLTKYDSAVVKTFSALAGAKSQSQECPSGCGKYNYLKDENLAHCVDSQIPPTVCASGIARLEDGHPCSIPKRLFFNCGVGQPCQDYVKDEQASLNCSNCRDEDNDGFSTCDGDCNDTNTEVGFYTHPGAVEKCGNNQDDNCNGSIDESPCCDDSDADGDEVSKCDGDCDDTHPGVQFNCDPCAYNNCLSLGGATWQGPPDCRCTDPSPILLDLAGDGFTLTGRANGVRFDLNGDGQKEQVSWTALGDDDDAWLALDRDGDGLISSGRELFGSFTHQPPSGEPNGFLALRLLDADNDGQITAEDPSFAALRLWVDANHDGISQPAELRTLVSQGVSSINTAYTETRRRDRYGNEFRYKGRVVIKGRKRICYDVLLTAQ
jgi:hypothetical protein